MKNPLIKDTFREINKTKGRFFSIFGIITLGVAFFTGIKVSSPVMKHTADKYYDENNLMDITLISNLGITTKDVEELSKIKGVEDVYPTYSKEVLSNLGTKQLVFKVHGIPKEENNSNINKLNLVEGKYPRKENECLVEDGDIPIGSKISIYGDNDEDLSKSIKNTEYTVVGKVENPYYVSHAKGSSSIGSGELDSYIMVLDSNFKVESYTESFITIAGAKSLSSYDESYEEYIKETKASIEELGKDRADIRYNEVIFEAKEQISNAKDELEDEETKANEELNKAYNELEKAKKDLNLGQSELAKKEEEFNETIDIANKKITEEENNLNILESELNLKYNGFNSNKENIQSQINSAKEEINKTEAKKKELEAYILSLEQQLANGDLDESEIAKLEEILKNSKDSLSVLNSEIQKAKDSLSLKEAEFINTEQKLVTSLASVKDGKTEIKKQKQNLKTQEEKALKGFNYAKSELSKGRTELEKGEVEYKENKAKVDLEISKSKKEISDKEKEINDIKEGRWYVLDRNANYGFVDYKNSTESIYAISKIFPVFFFSLAALICLTTMTRMVDEQRINIGTMKALGYNTPWIMFKYIVYALIASIGGSIFGCIIGFTIFPYIIYNAYESMTYTLPSVSLVFDIKLAMMATLIAVATTTLAVIFSCKKELIEVPSLLMRPKAPKEGKRILIERMPFIWNKLNFIQKVTCRNIFRYKKRFFMTVIGICGCTALLLTGFGIRDSISSIVDNQYGKVFKYSGTLTYKTDIEKDEDNGVISTLKKDNRIKDFENIKSKSFKAISGSIKKDATVIVPEDSNKLNQFISLQNRISKENYNMLNDGVIITEKLSKLLDVKEGDIIALENEDMEKFEVKVEGIVENYVNHYVYMTSDLYENLFKENVKFNQVILKTSSNDLKFEQDLGNDLMKLDQVSSCAFNTASKESFSSMVSNLNSVVILIIVSAGALAFIVLYNLTNVNISERIREIATIKVLGFYDGEVSSYVFRENVILTFIGTLVGLFLGIFLHSFIMTTAELEFTMFGREIKTMSFIISGILTMVFAGIVNFFMYYKLKKVQMVESLKSVD